MVSLSRADFIGDDGSPVLPFLLSARSQSLLLATATEIQDRSSWDDMSDSEWDELEGAIGEAIYEITEEIEPEDEIMPDKFTHVIRTTSQSLPVNTDTEVIFNGEVYNYGNLYNISSPDGLEFTGLPDVGIYLINFGLRIAGNGQKKIWMERDGDIIGVDERIEAAQTDHHITRLLPVGADIDRIRFYARCSGATTIAGDSGQDITYLTVVRLRGYPIG